MARDFILEGSPWIYHENIAGVYDFYTIHENVSLHVDLASANLLNKSA
jgi:hypothetical protein